MTKSIAEQIERVKASRWRNFKVIESSDQHVRWEGIMAPDKRKHLVRVTYRLTTPLENISLRDAQPRVQVLNPVLEWHPDYEEGPIPHVYKSSVNPSLPYLCLFSVSLREWNDDDYIADTTMFWAAEWLYFYEGWLITKRWYGGGRHIMADDEEKRLEPTSV